MIGDYILESERLLYHPFAQADVEIGYFICEAHEGRGYATEAAITMTAWGLRHLRQIGAEPKIVGKAEHENWGSRRVLEKAGYAFVKKERYVSAYVITG